ncbi:MAG: hypothetical protein HY538_02065 [Deltaproteobacteria bacterium]|nr:hypothetical protein [Deltaproteobacteria bacterium]
MKSIGLLRKLHRSCYALEDISKILEISRPSARVFCNRKVKSGDLIRLRRDLYILSEKWNQLGERELFLLSNLIQTPSYVSFQTALSFYGLTTQLHQNLIEAANPVRSKNYQVQSISFKYYYCQPSFYFGYRRMDGLFIADPEKALLDCLYFTSIGRYALDHSALNLKDIHWNSIEKRLKNYPKRVNQFYEKWRKEIESSRTT